MLRAARLLNNLNNHVGGFAAGAPGSMVEVNDAVDDCCDFCGPIRDNLPRGEGRLVKKRLNMRRWHLAAKDRVHLAAAQALQPAAGLEGWAPGARNAIRRAQGQAIDLGR